MKSLVFRKQGSQIKLSIGKKLEQLESRLKSREDKLEALFNNKEKLKSYMVRSSVTSYGHYMDSPSLYGKNEISREEVEEIDQMCRRIHELKKEINQLKMVKTHLADEDILELKFDDLVSFGFEVG